MKQAKIFILAVFSLLCISGADSYAGQSALLRLHLKKGDNYKITSHTTSKMVMMRNGHKLPVGQTFTSEYLLSVLEVRPNGNIMIGAMLDQFAMKMKVKGITSQFDIRKTKIEGKEGLRMYIQANKFIAVPLHLEFNNRAELIHSDMDSIYALLKLDTAESTKGIATQIIGNAKQVLTTVVFPADSVQQGSKWNTTVSPNSKPNAGSTEYILTSLLGDHAAIVSSSKNKTVMDSSTISLTFTNRNIVDISTGRLIQAKYRQVIKAPTKSKNSATPIRGTVELVVRSKKD